MGVFNWVQNKLGGKQEKRRSDVGSIAASGSSERKDRKEEFSDWPESLLAIGTFGTNNVDLKEEKKYSKKHVSRECSNPSHDLDFTLEEVTELQIELKKLLMRKPTLTSDGSAEGGGANLPLNRFLNCPSSLELDRNACYELRDDAETNVNGGDLSPEGKIILNKAKDLLYDHKSNIKQKSFSFLLKKMFVCRGGFATTPSLRDPISESRMEKLIRMILHKKIYPQNPAASLTKRYLEKKVPEKLCLPDKGEEKGKDRAKWVKTDAEYIVLEI